MKTLDSYDEKTQKILEPICDKLIQLVTLTCSLTGEKIGDNDSVYYDRNGIVSEGARNSTDSLYLGTLNELREWCRDGRSPRLRSKIAKVTKGAISQFLSKRVFAILLRRGSGPAIIAYEPPQDVAIEYKISEGMVVFEVVIRNNTKTSMQNTQVTLGVPDLTEIIKCEQMGSVDSGENAVFEIGFELQPGAEGELVGMLEYDTADGKHRTVHLRPIKIVT
jgi:hypothetical protein